MEESPVSENESKASKGMHEDSSGTEVAVPEADAPAITLLEVFPGEVLAFGAEPDGLERSEKAFELEDYKGELAQIATMVGAATAVGGNIAQTASQMQGLYRLSDSTLKILKNGGQLAAKDGATLGAILKNGKIVSQARFIPVAPSALSAAIALGPAIAMAGLQFQLSHISTLLNKNIEISNKILDTIERNKRQEFQGVFEAIDNAAVKVQAYGGVPSTVWDEIKDKRAKINEAKSCYKEKLQSRLSGLRSLNKKHADKYLEENAKDIIFEVHASFASLKADVQYEIIRLGRDHVLSESSELEKKAFDDGCLTLPKKIESDKNALKTLIDELQCELGIKAEIFRKDPAKRYLRKSDSKTAEFTWDNLLEIIKPMANLFRASRNGLKIPATSCSPEGMDLKPYLGILQWHMDLDDELKDIAFPCEIDSNTFLQGELETVESSWGGLVSGSSSGWGIAWPFEKNVPPVTFVAVTGQRIFKAQAQNFPIEAKIESIDLKDIKYVRPRQNRADLSRPTVGIATTKNFIEWIFPQGVDENQVDEFTAVLAQAKEKASAIETRK